MRIWDLHPGYLNRQSLLGEHRELHAIVSILVHHKKGYAHHPETLRWAVRGWALRQRHRLLSAEMALRGYHDRSPVTTRTGKDLWPDTFVDAPSRQFQILRDKYRDKEPGRIPLPKSAQQCWSHHKYSVMARDVGLYRKLGREVAGTRAHTGFSELIARLVLVLRQPPSPGGLKNALQHMWGYVADVVPGPNSDVNSWPPGKLLDEIQRRSLAIHEPYLTASTALSELGAWTPRSPSTSFR